MPGQGPQDTAPRGPVLGPQSSDAAYGTRRRGTRTGPFQHPRHIGRLGPLASRTFQEPAPKRSHTQSCPFAARTQAITPQSTPTDQSRAAGAVAANRRGGRGARGQADGNQSERDGALRTPWGRVDLGIVPPGF